MTINEMYYLAMVCAAFAGLGFFLAVEPLAYRVAKQRPRAPRRELD